uniref:Uncharacterized protein n=1 Tax=Ditylenchus dipsaci TaxID=166011 RepID=A0A915DUX3_9BILA
MRIGVSNNTPSLFRFTVYCPRETIVNKGQQQLAVDLTKLLVLNGLGKDVPVCFVSVYTCDDLYLKEKLHKLIQSSSVTVCGMGELPAKRSPVVVFVTSRTTTTDVPVNLFDIARTNRPVNHVLCHATHGLFIIGDMNHLASNDKYPFASYLNAMSKFKNASVSCSADGMIQFEEQSLIADCSISTNYDVYQTSGCLQVVVLKSDEAPVPAIPAEVGLWTKSQIVSLWKAPAQILSMQHKCQQFSSHSIQSVPNRSISPSLSSLCGQGKPKLQSIPRSPSSRDCDARLVGLTLVCKDPVGHKGDA